MCGLVLGFGCCVQGKGLPLHKPFTELGYEVVSIAGRPKHRKLDIVISHYQQQNVPEVSQIWKDVISIPYVQAQDPYLFVYCKDTAVAEQDLKWFGERGEVRRLGNFGRESHTYVWHILHNLDDLANHTLFHQDMPDDVQQLTQRLGLLSPSTGLLALSLTGTCSCKDCWLHHIPKVTEIWAMAQQTFCHPTDVHVVFLRGAFVVSSQRVQAVSSKIYASLLQYLEAPEPHWVHTEHAEEWAKTPSNPMSAHVLERSWNILFDCLDPDIFNVCEVCDNTLTINGTCPPSACQCSDYII